MAERHLQEVLIVVRQELVDLFLLVVALLLLLIDEHEDRERQADRRHDVAQELPRVDVHSQASQKTKGAPLRARPCSFAQLRSYSGTTAPPPAAEQGCLARAPS